MTYRSIVVLTIVLLAYSTCFSQEESWQELLEQANTLTNKNEHESAIAFGQRALKLAKDQYGPADKNVAVVLARLSGFYYHTGQYSKAEACMVSVLQIREAIYGPNGPKVADSYLHLGNMRLEAADYVRAQEHYDRSLSIRESVFGPNHIHVANVLGQRSILFRRKGRYSEAERDLLRALQIYEDNEAVLHKPGDSLKKATILRGLGNLYRTLGKNEAAESLLTQSLMIQEKIDSPLWEYGSTLSNLASTYLSLNRLSEADSVGRLALEVTIDALGPEHPWVADVYRIRAQIDFAFDRHDDALNKFEKSLEIHQSTLASSHPQIATDLEQISDLARSVGDYGQALKLSERAWRIRSNSFNENAMFFREQDALRFAHRLKQSVNGLLSVALDFGFDSLPDPEAVARVILSSKGQVSDGIFERQKSLVSETDSVTVATVAKLQVAKMQLSSHYVRSSGSSGMSRDSLQSLLQTIEELEAELIIRSVVYRARHELLSLTTGLVSYMLPRSSVLVEFMKFSYLNNDSKKEVPSYLALVLEDNGGFHLQYLGEATRLDSMVDEYRRHMVRIASRAGMPNAKDLTEFRAIAHKLYVNLWKPIEKNTDGKGLVFVAPDAGLNLISFATLIDTSGRYLIESTTLHYLSAGRDLVRAFGERQMTEGLLAIGDPDYDSRSIVFPVTPTSTNESQDTVVIKNTMRQVPSCEQFKSLRVSALPLTRYEIQQIEKSWKEGINEPVSVYFGANANEARFKAEATGHRVIHLATHGYYISKECLESENTFDDNWIATDHPLLLSGLLLAGANQRDSLGDENAYNDGILTAYEISDMNLRGTELVVLSACETGLGSVEDGEGVYGLRRAFQMAGAQTVLSSLWSVSDRHTAQFMSKLYRRSDKNLPERIRELQLAQLADLRAKGMSDHPVNWGPFIASGSWR